MSWLSQPDAACVIIIYTHALLSKQLGDLCVSSHSYILLESEALAYAAMPWTHTFHSTSTEINFGLFVLGETPLSCFLLGEPSDKVSCAVITT